ncbi:MAG: PilZ domain-containing protein [Candidatus Electrothrix communis]|nr:PilZ domain-containing protein [Desulfobulbus sp. US4]WLE95654.1 MAG: PilZ domain-containing protein [Candidatus Electrothrix communis]
MEHAADRRQFTRVDILLDVCLDFGVRRYRHFANNLSLSGLYVKGFYEQKAGDVCIIEIKQADCGQDSVIRAVCSAVRVDETGMALRFISMKIDSFLLLQTVFSSFAEDPKLLGGESLEDISFTLEDGLIMYDNTLPLKNHFFPTV